MKDDQWQKDMCNGVAAAHLKRTITLEEGAHLRKSALAEIDEDRMDYDTECRTGGLCPRTSPGPRGQLGVFVELRMAFNKLKQSRN